MDDEWNGGFYENLSAIQLIVPIARGDGCASRQKLLQAAKTAVPGVSESSIKSGLHLLYNYKILKFI